MSLRTGVLPCVLAIGCGPAVAPPDASGDDGAATTGVSSGSSTSSTTSTTSPPLPTTTGTPGTTADDGSSSSTGDADFITEPDGYPEMVECDIWLEDCPRGEKCMPYANDGGNAWNALRCVPVAPDPGAPGDPCTVEGNGVSGIDDCEKHAMCWDVDPETGMGTCVAFCTGSPNNPTCEDPTTDCTITSEGILTLCLPGCDPLLQDCLEGEMCVGVDDEFFCVPDGPGDGQAGDPCETVDGCALGLACVGATAVPGCITSGCCSPYCDVNVEPACPFDGQVCYPWWPRGAAPPEHEHVGVCAVPP